MALIKIQEGGYYWFYADPQGSGPHVFSYATVDDTATAGKDYEAANSSLTAYPGGGRVFSRKYSIFNDDIFEDIEVFRAYYSNGKIDDFAILDDEDIPKLSVSSRAVSEGDVEHTVQVAIRADHAAARAYNIQIRTERESGYIDFFNVTMPANEKVALFDLPVYGNVCPGPDRLVYVTAMSDYSSASGKVTIQDDDVRAHPDVAEAVGSLHRVGDNVSNAPMTQISDPGIIFEIEKTFGALPSDTTVDVAPDQDPDELFSDGKKIVAILGERARSEIAASETRNSREYLSAWLSSGYPGQLEGTVNGILWGSAVLAGGLLLTGGAAVVPLLAGVAFGIYKANDTANRVAATINITSNVAGQEPQRLSARAQSDLALSSSGPPFGVGDSNAPTYWNFDTKTGDLTITGEITPEMQLKLDQVASRLGLPIDNPVALIVDGDIAAGGKNDLLIGGSGDDVIRGLTGDDMIAGLRGADKLEGGDGSDKLDGGLGNDRLDGGAGNDKLTGGGGDDTFVVDRVEDKVLELANQGNDLIESSVSLVLAPNVENLLLVEAAGTSSGKGNGLANSLTGNSSANSIDGGSGNDVIEGRGGGDALIGGSGLDTLSYASSAVGVSVALNGTSSATTAGGDSAGDVAIGFENIIGTGFEDTLTGDKNANVIEGGTGADTLSGGLGLDTLSYASSTKGVTATLVKGDRASVAGGDATGDIATEFEAVTGSAYEDVLTGDGDANVLTGLARNDTLDGKGGIDTLVGGLGDDIYVLDQIGDKVIELAGQGADTIRIGASYVLGANLENLELQGTGDLAGTGNELANKIIGTGGKNTLDGGAGADTLVGGAGDDTYVADNTNDSVVELDNEGIDLVLSSASFDLSNYVEKLTLTGTAAIDGMGNAFKNTILGNSAANVIVGGGDADVLDGGGGFDTLSYAGSLSGVTVTLMGSAVAALVSGGDADGDSAKGFENVLGSAQADTLTGDGGANVLDGGANADTLTGGLGNDTYVVDNVGDLTLESDKGGIDTVRSAISWTLGDFLESLVLVGTADIAGTGNSLANTITGNAGKNLLDGGAGADKLIGGASDDTYIIDNVGDKITEAAGAAGGVDEAISYLAAYTLAANVENLSLLGAAVSGTGNALNNSIRGNSASNVLSGGAGDDILEGGDGADILSGGTGKDTFVFTTPDDGGPQGDTIKDYSFALGDRIGIEGLWFGDLAPGALDASLFETLASGGATGVGNASIRFFYDLAADKLYYDSDGGDRSNAKLLASFATATTVLSASDFKVI